MESIHQELYRQSALQPGTSRAYFIMPDSPEYYWINAPSIIVDDSDPAIRFNGTWHAANETEIRPRFFNEREPLFWTLHVLQIFSGSFSYNFTGEGISVFAMSIANSNYTSQCFLDGNEVHFDSNATEAQFGQSRPVCAAFGLPDNSVHTISVVVSVPPREQQQVINDPLSGFAFDYILIQPLSGVTPWDNANQDVFLPILDMLDIETSTQPTLNFGLCFQDTGSQIADVSRGWKFDPENGFHTTTPGSQFNVTFTGTSLWWYGYANATEVDAASSSFSIDGGAPQTFGEPHAPVSQFVFSTPVLQYATHLLTVTYHDGAHSNGVSLPLTLQSLIIQKSIQGTVTPTGTLGSLPSTTMSNLPTSPASTKGGKLGGIAGGIGGGIAFLLLLGSGLFVLTRWTRRKRQSTQTGAQSAMLMPEPFAIHAEGAVPIRVSRKARASQQNIDNPAMQELAPPPVTKWTRRHAHMPGSSSASASIQEQQLSGSPLNQPLIHVYPQLRPTGTDTMNRRSAARIGDAVHPTTPDVMVSTGVPGAEGEREDDSGLWTGFVLPPLYTTH